MNKDLTALFDEIEQRGMTIASFSKKTGIPKDRIYQWKNGRGHPKAKDAVLIQDFLNEGVVKESESFYGKKITAAEAMLSVLMQRVSHLLAKQNHTSEIVELKQIEKDAQALREMQN